MKYAGKHAYLFVGNQRCRVYGCFSRVPSVQTFQIEPWTHINLRYTGRMRNFKLLLSDGVTEFKFRARFTERCREVFPPFYERLIFHNVQSIESNMAPRKKLA